MLQIKNFKWAYFFLFLSAISTYSCTAQKKVVEMQQCSKSNTGFKGRVPKEYMDRPNSGHDFYSISLKINKKCTIEVVDLTVKNEGKVLSVKPQLDNGSSKMSFLTGETCYIRADFDGNQKILNQTLNGEGFLTLKINGKTTKLEIKSFEMILPN